jgi:hypothetical protein
MSDSEDADFEALLIEADVKEDFSNLGFDDEVVKSLVLDPQDQVVPKSDEGKPAAGTSSGKKYKVKMVSDSSDYCLSYIGSGASFCLRRKCLTNHGTSVGVGGQSSFVPSVGGVLVILKNPNVAFSSPSLKLSSVEEEVVDAWEGVSLSMEEWQDNFQASNQGEDVVMSIADIKIEAKASKGFDSFRTPAKKKRVVISRPEVVIEAYAPAFESNEARSVFKKSATSASIANAVCEIDLALNKLGRSVYTTLLGVKESTREAEATADMSFRMSRGLEGVLGSSDVMDESDLVCPTVWGTLATIGAEVTTLKDRKIIIPPPAAAPDLGPLRTELKEAQSKISTSVTKLGSFSRLFAKTMLKRVSDAELEIKRLMAHSRPQKTDTFGDELDGLLAAAAAPSGKAPPAKSTRSDNEERFRDLEDKLDQVLASNEELERRLARILAESEVDSVKFAGLGLRSVEEVQAWVETNFPKRAYGLVIDAYLLFDLIADEGPSNQNEMMTEMKRRLDLDIATEAEGQALTAFLAEVPRLFHTRSTTLQMSGDNASFFSKVPTYKAWANSGGLKKTIEHRLSKLKKSLREVLSSELVAGTMAYVVAVEALEKSVSWIGAFNTYLDTTYEHLHNEVGFTSARAWSLTTQLGNRIFSDLHTVRVGTMKAIGKGPESICPQILWAVFRTHDQMAGFEDANFENHPSIASEFVKFLATNTGIEGMGVLQEEVATMKSKLKEAEKQATLASGKADKASSTADVAKKAVDALTRQVDKLTAKVG